MKTGQTSMSLETTGDKMTMSFLFSLSFSLADSSKTAVFRMKKSFKFQTDACHLRPQTDKKQSSIVKRTFQNNKGSNK